MQNKIKIEMILKPGLVMHTRNSIAQEAEAGESGVYSQPKLDSESSSQNGQQERGKSETLRWGESIHCVLQNHHSDGRSEGSQTSKTHQGLQETKEVFWGEGELYKHTFWIHIKKEKTTKERIS